MNFDLTDEQRAIQSLASEFAEHEVKPRAEKMDHDEAFPVRARCQDGRTGVHGSAVPRGIRRRRRRYGQLRARGHGDCARRRVDGDHHGGARLARGDAVLPLFGTQNRKNGTSCRWRKARCSGVSGLTEPNAGSDAGKRLDQGHSRETVTGSSTERRRSSRAPGTDISGGSTITAVTGTRPDGKPEISNLIVPQTTPGFMRSKKYKKMGWRASDTRELSFADASGSRRQLARTPRRGIPPVFHDSRRRSHLRGSAFHRLVDWARTTRPLNTRKNATRSAVRSASFRPSRSSSSTCSPRSSTPA